MSKTTKQRGDWTWELIHDYHRCPHCGYILESRQPFLRCHDQFRKDLKCERCGQGFVVTQTFKD